MSTARNPWVDFVCGHSITVVRRDAIAKVRVRFPLSAPDFCAGITQLVECQISTLNVAGSFPVARSSLKCDHRTMVSPAASQAVHRGPIPLDRRGELFELVMEPVLKTGGCKKPWGFESLTLRHLQRRVISHLNIFTNRMHKEAHCFSCGRNCA